MTPLARIITALFLIVRTAEAQTPGVPVYDEVRPRNADAAARKAAIELQKTGVLVGFQEIEKQLVSRTECSLKLPAPSREKLSSRDLWKRARNAHLRIGWLYRDHKKTQWQINFAGGYAITADGAVATCYHVIEPDKEEMKEGYLIAATDDEKVYPVTEVLAASHDTDSCILRIKADNLTVLPIGTDVSPGDPVVCFSEPMGRRGYYSTSIVNRFVQRTVDVLKKKDPVPAKVPVYIEVGTDWAPGSSGAAVIDQFGNAVGHVSTIESIVEEGDPKQKKKGEAQGTFIIFHDAISSKHVKELVKEK